MADRKGSKKGEVGYGRPPKHSQYQKGQSGNPRGRPPKPKPEPGESMLSEFMRMGTEEVEFVDKKTGEKQKMRPRTAVLRKLWSEATQDAKTGLIVLNLHRSEAVEGKEKEELAKEDEAILQRLSKRFECSRDNADTTLPDNGDKALRDSVDAAKSDEQSDQ